MLKIKYNVDLKELEKYGFESRNYLFGNKIYQTPISLREDNSNKPCLRVRSYTREIETYGKGKINDPNVYLLYDLIKDGLVEKVED